MKPVKYSLYNPIESFRVRHQRQLDAIPSGPIILRPSSKMSLEEDSPKHDESINAITK